MITYIIRRLIQAGIVIVLVTIFVFLLMRLLPGDPILMYVAADDLAVTSPEEIAALRHQFGFDKPLTMQYFDWVGGVLHGDLGQSIFLSSTVAQEIARALPKTFHVGALAFLLSLFVGYPWASSLR